jgi:hypothetical protein
MREWPGAISAALCDRKSYPMRTLRYGSHVAPRPVCNKLGKNERFRYDEAGLGKVSNAVQAALMNTLRVPPEAFYQLIFELPKIRFRHTPSFVGMHYTDDLIILDVTFIQGRPKETRLALLKGINTRIAEAAGASPDDMLITFYEVPGENISFGQGDAQRANTVVREGA